jgi:hypothetical protein
MPRQSLALAAALAIALALPGQAAFAQESTSDRVLRGIVNGVLEEFVPQDYGREYLRDGPRHRHERNRHERRDGRVHVPPGHRPPPGTCRVWFPDRPPGHQPRPGSCNVRVPRGAFLVYG